MKIVKKYDNLAQFVFARREELGLSALGLAAKAGLDVKIVADIESGLELFLSSTIRQKLAKGLKVSLDEIKAYEKREEFNFVSKEVIEDLKNSILQNAGSKGFIPLCPICKNKLEYRIAKLYDLEDNLVLHPKARCTKCPFQLTS